MDGVRLKDLLPDDVEEAGKRAVATLRQQEDVGCEKLAWDVVSQELEGALGRALDRDLIGLVAECWAQSRILADFANPQKHPRGERSVVELGAHEFSRDVPLHSEVESKKMPLSGEFALPGDGVKIPRMASWDP